MEYYTRGRLCTQANAHSYIEAMQKGEVFKCDTRVAFLSESGELCFYDQNTDVDPAENPWFTTKTDEELTRLIKASSIVVREATFDIMAANERISKLTKVLDIRCPTRKKALRNDKA